MDLIQNKDYAADSCAISPTAFLLCYGMSIVSVVDFINVT